MRFNFNPQISPSARDLTKNILMEELGIDWTCENPEADSNQAIIPQEQLNPEVEYIGKLVDEIKIKLDNIYKLSGEVDYNTKNTISALISISNSVETKLSALEYSAQIMGQDSQQIIIGGQMQL